MYPAKMYVDNGQFFALKKIKMADLSHKMVDLWQFITLFVFSPQICYVCQALLNNPFSDKFNDG